MPHSTKAKWDEWYKKNKHKRNQTYNDWYRRNKEKIAAKKDELRKRNPERYKGYTDRAKKSRRQAIAEYKLERGCHICGYKGHPDALHFDHLPGCDKKGNISQIYRGKWADVLKEIAKCQVLCANCHAIETASRRRVIREAKKKEQSEIQLNLFLA